MNASEVLKGFAMKQVYSYLDKDPEANLPNLLDMLEKYDKNGQAVTTQVEGIRAALSPEQQLVEAGEEPVDGH